MIEYKKIFLDVYSYRAVSVIAESLYAIKVPKFPFADPYERPLFNDTNLRNYIGVNEFGEYFLKVELEHNYTLDFIKQICKLHLTYLKGQYTGTVDPWWTVSQKISHKPSPSGAVFNDLNEAIDLDEITMSELEHVINHWEGIGTDEDESFVGCPFDPFKSVILKNKLDRFKEISEDLCSPKDANSENPYTWKDFEECRGEILAMLGVPYKKYVYTVMTEDVKTKSPWKILMSFFNNKK